MDANMLLAWHRWGGGKELLAKLYASLGLNVVSFPYGPMATQPLGWFKKPITSVDDFKGIKYRTVGISIDMFTAMGAAVNALPGGEIVSAIDRGLLDAAEFNNASSDRLLGFADVSKVCMLQSYHQNAEQLEITFNKAKYDALPDKMKAIIANSVSAASQEMQWKAIDRYSKDYIELQTKDKVKFYKTPDSILQAQLKIFDDIVKKYSATGAARGLGAGTRHVADLVHAAVAGDHLRARLAARVDRDHHHLRADLSADAQALQYRPDPVGYAGVREPAGGVPVAAGGDVGVLPQGCRAQACHAQPDFRRHDALHDHRDHMHGHHVFLAGHDVVAAELSLRHRLRSG